MMDKDKESVFREIEACLLSAAREHFPEGDLAIWIDRHSGFITATHNGAPIDPDLLKRISAETAKQIMIKKVREAERRARQSES